MKNGVQLIAYADRFGGDLQGLKQVMEKSFSGAFSGVHILPFFTPFDGADAGFDPTDHETVDPRLGSWRDIATLADEFDVMCDVIVNHVSHSSGVFEDVRRHGRRSAFADMFLTFEDVFPGGADEPELAAIYRPRPGLPFTVMTMGGEKRLLWTTFTPGQVDVNIRSEAAQAYLLRILRRAAESGVRCVRLDAVGYVAKRRGTSCFMTPDTFDFIANYTKAAHSLGVEVLVEVHSHVEDQIAIASQVDRVYDFALPPLILSALFTGSPEALRRWIDIRPVNAVTVLDTHDGIGIIDVGPGSADGPPRPGLLSAEEIDALVQGIHANTGGVSLRATGAAASNLDLYQVNSTFYDALGRDDRAMLIARAVQFFLPGVPQVYYVGALAGMNDSALLERTGVGRDVNRHRYTTAEIEQELLRPVVRGLLRLCRLRTELPAFEGDFASGGQGSALVLSWRTSRASHGMDSFARIEADVAARSLRLEWGVDGKTYRVDDLLEEAWPDSLPG